MVEERQGDLKEIAGLSGEVPVFDGALLRSLTWASRHYVAPLAVLLSRATPPNLPKLVGEAVPPIGPGPVPEHPLSPITMGVAQGRRRPVQAMVGAWQGLEWLGSLRPVAEARLSSMVVVASAAEAGRIAERLRDHMGAVVVGVAGDDDAAVTRAWDEAQVPGRVIVGTPRVTTWRVAGLALALVLEEGRRAMKDRQTPTLHVREVMRNRSLLERWTLVFYGPTPSVELLASGAEVVRVAGRAWPLVEVVDRSEEPPGAGFLSERVIAAMRATLRRGERCFVFTHRRLGHASMRCVACRSVRRCRSCGSALGRVEECPRCGAGAGACPSCGGSRFEEMGTIPERLVAEIERRIGGGAAGLAGESTPVEVGTERDLAGTAPVVLAVAADADGMLHGVGHRDSEESLRQLARVANLARAGQGHRMMVQTSSPGSDLMRALRRGDPIPYLETILVERARQGLPPSTEAIAVEVRGPLPEEIEEDLHGLTGATVMGPARQGDATRWLVSGQLAAARGELRELAERWRDAGTTVRLDADPIDL